MSLRLAGAFSVGAQTAFSIVRKLELDPGAPVLVTSAASNTSLFAIGALRHSGAAVYAATSSEEHAGRLLAQGVAHVIVTGRDTDAFSASHELESVSRDLGGFAAVVDPFFDLHMERALHLLAPFGRYVTCGHVAQTPGSARSAGVHALPVEQVMDVLILNNLSIIGNCIGRREDLERALQAFALGRLSPVLDSVYSGEDSAAFLHRTFKPCGRFGKVVFEYDA